MAQELYKIESLGIIKRQRGRDGVKSYTNFLLFFLQKDLCIVKRYDLPCVNVTALCFKFDTCQFFIFTVFVCVFLKRPDVFESVRNTVKCVMKGLKGNPKAVMFHRNAFTYCFCKSL